MMIGKLSPLVAATVIICTPAIAKEEYPLIKIEAYIVELQKMLNEGKVPANAVVNSAEVFASSDGEKFYIAFGAARSVLATSPAQETPCQSPHIDSNWAGPIWYTWCVSDNNHPDHEAKRDMHLSFGGRPPSYWVSSHYNCQDYKDFLAMPPKVRNEVCP
jgi:hypothetical protein